MPGSSPPRREHECRQAAHAPPGDPCRRAGRQPWRLPRRRAARSAAQLPVPDVRPAPNHCGGHLVRHRHGRASRSDRRHRVDHGCPPTDRCGAHAAVHPGRVGVRRPPSNGPRDPGKPMRDHGPPSVRRHRRAGSGLGRSGLPSVERLRLRPVDRPVPVPGPRSHAASPSRVQNRHRQAECARPASSMTLHSTRHVSDVHPSRPRRGDASERVSQARHLSSEHQHGYEQRPGVRRRAEQTRTGDRRCAEVLRNGRPSDAAHRSRGARNQEQRSEARRHPTAGSVAIGQNAKEGPEGPLSREKSGGVLLSQGESTQVPSAQAGLTSVFGMGTGVTPPL